MKRIKSSKYDYRGGLNERRLKRRKNTSSELISLHEDGRSLKEINRYDDLKYEAQLKAVGLLEVLNEHRREVWRVTRPDSWHFVGILENVGSKLRPDKGGWTKYPAQR